ncbi:MAG: alpha/beta fold hydrolase [Spirochaetes bacterium]|nr:alpha/beta fold hydrolase [Spirochaetota bacterium]
MIEIKQSITANKAILLLHGMTGEPAELYYLGKYLHRLGFDVYIPELPGHCQGTEALKRTTWQDWLNFSFEEYDRLKKEYDVVYISGICLGAVLALCVAMERDDLEKIACLSTTLFLDGWSIPKIIFLLPVVLYTVIKFFYAWPESSSLGVKNEKVRGKVQEALEKDDAKILDCFPAISILQILRLSRYTIKRLSKVKSEVLIIHSERDDIASTKSGDIVYKNIGSKIKEYIKLKDSYHLIVLDDEKDFVFKKTGDFFMGL